MDHVLTGKILRARRGECARTSTHRRPSSSYRRASVQTTGTPPSPLRASRRSVEHPGHPRCYRVSTPRFSAIDNPPPGHSHSHPSRKRDCMKPARVPHRIFLNRPGHFLRHSHSPRIIDSVSLASGDKIIQIQISLQVPIPTHLSSILRA